MGSEGVSLGRSKDEIHLSPRKTLKDNTSVLSNL